MIKILLIPKECIKLIQFSATPDGNINDISDWDIYSTKIKLNPGLDYYGPKDAINQKRVKQYKDLSILDNVLDLKNDIEGKFQNSRYYLIRVPSKKVNKQGINNQFKVIDNFKEVFGADYEYNINYLNFLFG